MFAHATLMCLTAVILFGAFCREPNVPPSRGRALFVFLPAVIMALSPRSYEALMGFGFPHYLEILFYVAALRLLGFGTGAIAFAGGMACAEGATFSLANGLWIWPIGLVVLLSRRMFLRGAVWTTVAAATIVAYFHGYLPTGNHPDPAFFAEHPLGVLEHFLALNGTVFATTVPVAIACGTIALVLYLWVCALVLRDWWHAGERPPYGFWLMATVLASNATITAGRAIFGPIQALDSRYAAMIALAPIGLYWCLFVRRGTWRLGAPAVRLVAAGMVAGYAITSVETWAAAPEWYSRKEETAYLLYTMANQPDSLVLKTYPIVVEGRWFSAQLQQLQINVFAEPHIRSRRSDANAGPSPAADRNRQRPSANVRADRRLRLRRGRSPRVRVQRRGERSGARDVSHDRWQDGSTCGHRPVSAGSAGRREMDGIRRQLRRLRVDARRAYTLAESGH